MEKAITKIEILDRLLNEYASIQTSGVSTVEGSFTFDTLSANAVEFEKAYAEIMLVLEAAFPQSSWGEYLTLKAEEHGIRRQQAIKAVVELTVKGKAGTIVPIGSVFATASGVSFISTKEATIAGDGAIKIMAQAKEAGAGGNVKASSINKIPVAIYGVSGVVNELEAHDGFDLENDEALLNRLLFKVQKPATSGNCYHYQLWATSVDGVSMVKVLPLWAGNGTVKILVLDANKQAASENILEAVREKIAVNAPIGATCTVAAPELLTVNISLKVTDGVGNVNGIKNVVNDYFSANALALSSISYAQIGKAILGSPEITGVRDYSDLLINNGSVNIPVGSEQLPVAGMVTLNE